MLKKDTYGLPYTGRSLFQEIKFRVGSMIQNLPTYIPLATFLTILILAGLLG